MSSLYFGQAEADLESLVHLFHYGRIQMRYLLSKSLPIDCAQLFKKGYRVLGKSTLLSGEFHVGRQFCLANAGRDSSYNRCRAVTVPDIVLKYQDRPYSSLF